jgi:hypothetical protein
MSLGAASCAIKEWITDYFEFSASSSISKILFTIVYSQENLSYLK